MSVELVPCPTPVACGVVYGHEPASPALRRCLQRRSGKIPTDALDRPVLVSKPEETIEINGVFVSMARARGKVTYAFDHEESGGFAQATYDMPTQGLTLRPHEVLGKMLELATSGEQDDTSLQYRGLMRELFGSDAAVLRARAEMDRVEAGGEDAHRVIDLDAAAAAEIERKQVRNLEDRLQRAKSASSAWN